MRICEPFAAAGRAQLFTSSLRGSPDARKIPIRSTASPPSTLSHHSLAVWVGVNFNN